MWHAYLFLQIAIHVVYILSNYQNTKLNHHRIENVSKYNYLFIVDRNCLPLQTKNEDGVDRIDLSFIGGGSAQCAIPGST